MCSNNLLINFVLKVLLSYCLEDIECCDCFVWGILGIGKGYFFYKDNFKGVNIKFL